jgi:hypothetical protein
VIKAQYKKTLTKHHQDEATFEKEKDKKVKKTRSVSIWVSGSLK